MRSRNLVSFFLLPLIENGSNVVKKMIMFSFGMSLDLEIFKYVASLVK